MHNQTEIMEMRKTSYKKGFWSLEEDKLLTAAVTKELKLLQQRIDPSVLQKRRRSPLDWQAIGRKVVTRTGKQCRERWINHLSPEISKAKWTAEEDCILLRLGRRFPNSWAYIARYLPNRSQNHVKIRWKSLTRPSKLKKASATNVPLGSLIDQMDSQLWGEKAQVKYELSAGDLSSSSISEPVNKRPKHENFFYIETPLQDSDQVLAKEIIPKRDNGVLEIKSCFRDRQPFLRTLSVDCWFHDQNTPLDLNGPIVNNIQSNYLDHW